jgi:Fe-S cluster assembly iron-binding protein IscA
MSVRAVSFGMQPHISITTEAAARLAEELDGRILRVAFTTGCGGSGFRLASADAPADGDVVVEIGAIQVALDDMSACKLDGAVIEYNETEDGYTINHPAAVSAVWCG